jgi:hypothetical protein
MLGFRIRSCRNIEAFDATTVGRPVRDANACRHGVRAVATWEQNAPFIHAHACP